jgi:hypothetical protein
MPTKKQTSSRVSSMAAKLLAKLPKRGTVVVYDSGGIGFDWQACAEFPVRTLRSILASAISQDETPQPKAKPLSKRDRSGLAAFLELPKAEKPKRRRAK